MDFDYSKLLGKMKEKSVTQEVLAKEIGISLPTMSLKLNNRAMFKQDEMYRICKFLEIDFNDMLPYFFTEQRLET